MALWRNNKKGSLYHVLSFDALNCTNAQDGQVCVAYRSATAHDGELYFREREEFFSKFTEVFDFVNRPGGIAAVEASGCVLL